MVSSRQVDFAHVMKDRSRSSGGSLLAQALAAQFDAIGVVDDPIEDGVCQGGITEHVEMPQRLTAESLRFGWLTPIILCMVRVIRSVNDTRAEDRR